jgi:hypothetical protein
MIRYASLAATAFAALLANPLAAQDVRVQVEGSDLQAQTTPLAAAPLTSVATTRVATTHPTPAAPGPTMQASMAGVRTPNDAAAPLSPVAVDRVGRNPALMIVGGAALVIGAIIGGDAGTIVMVGGAVTGLIGLWSFLR